MSLSCFVMRFQPCFLFLLLISALPVSGQQSLQFTGQGQSVAGLGSAEFGVSTDVITDIQGYVLAVGCDSDLLSIENLVITGTDAEAAGAELVVAEIFNVGFTLGVVLDAVEPFDGHVIPAATDMLYGRPHHNYCIVGNVTGGGARDRTHEVRMQARAGGFGRTASA